MTRVGSDLVPRFQSLERRLQQMGFYTGAIDDDWGSGVDTAIDKLFARAGYKAPAPIPHTRAPDPGIWTKVPASYRWLAKLGDLPNLIDAALPLLGTDEYAGSANSPILMGWRDQLKKAGVKNVDGFTADAIPWCGLGAAKFALDAGYVDEIPTFPLWALNWGGFGVEAKQPCLGSICTFKRETGGHVALYIAEDRQGYYHVLGCNQSNSVTITRIAKTRLKACREAAYNVRPASAKPYIVAAGGTISTNEA